MGYKIYIKGGAFGSASFSAIIQYLFIFTLPIGKVVFTTRMGITCKLISDCAAIRRRAVIGAVILVLTRCCITFTVVVAARRAVNGASNAVFTAFTNPVAAVRSRAVIRAAVGVLARVYVAQAVVVARWRTSPRPRSCCR